MTGSAPGGASATVDVLIVSFNTRDILRDCLRSIERHPAPGVTTTVSVLDNMSRDGTAEMIIQEFPRVRLLRSQENMGFGRANNELARTSQADYLLLLNPDTVWTQDILSPLRAALDARPDAVVVGPKLVWPNGGTQLSSQSFPSLRLTFAHLLDGTKVPLPRPVSRRATELVRHGNQLDLPEDRTPRKTDWIWATCWLMRRSDVVRDGLFDPRYTLYDEDLDYCRRARARDRTVLYHPGVDVVHIGEASSQPRQRQDRMWRARRRYYGDHHGGAAAAVYSSLVVGARFARALGERSGR